MWHAERLPGLQESDGWRKTAIDVFKRVALRRGLNPLPDAYLFYRERFFRRRHEFKPSLGFSGHRTSAPLSSDDFHVTQRSFHEPHGWTDRLSGLRRVEGV